MGAYAQKHSGVDVDVSERPSSWFARSLMQASSVLGKKIEG